MRVLYLIDSLAPGGAERSLAALAPAYRDRGVALEVAYLHERDGVRADLEAAGARVSSLAEGGGRAGWIRRATALVRARRPDLVHTTLFEADVAGRLAARRARVPVVSSLVNDVYGPAHLSHPGLRRWKVRGAQAVDAATARLAVRLHAVSTPVADVMARRLRYPRARIEVVARGRDLAALGERTPARRERARAGLAVGPDDDLVLAVGRQDHQKGLDVLLDAFARLRRRRPRARLVVAGRHGDQSAHLDRFVRDRGLEDAVRLLGERDDVADLLCAADVFALPSRREGIPGAMLEAMALATPVVASDLPATREVAGHGPDDSRCALLVPPGAAEALAAALDATLAAPDPARRRAVAARARYRDRFQIDGVADAMVGFYGRALDRSR